MKTLECESWESHGTSKARENLNPVQYRYSHLQPFNQSEVEGVGNSVDLSKEPILGGGGGVTGKGGVGVWT